MATSTFYPLFEISTIAVSVFELIQFVKIIPNYIIQLNNNPYLKYQRKHITLMSIIDKTSRNLYIEILKHVNKRFCLIHFYQKLKSVYKYKEKLISHRLNTLKAHVNQ